MTQRRPLVAVAAGALILVATTALPKMGTPGPDYFKGLYARVGRNGSDPAQLINDVVRVDPAGAGLAITDCSGSRFHLDYDPSFDAVNFLIGHNDGVPIECQFHNNGDNYPILTCAGADSRRFTLWPQVEHFKDALSCAG